MAALGSSCSNGDARASIYEQRPSSLRDTPPDRSNPHTEPRATSSRERPRHWSSAKTGGFGPNYSNQSATSHLNIAQTETQETWNEICVDIHNMRPCHTDTDGGLVNATAISGERWRSMHTCSALWLQAVLMCATVSDPLDAIGTASSHQISESSSISQPYDGPLLLAPNSSGPLTTTNRHAQTTPATTRRRIKMALARYTTVQPQSLHPRPLAPVLDEHWDLRPLFIGPRHAVTVTAPSQTPGATFAEGSSFTPFVPRPPDDQPSFTLSAMPYQGNECERMNDASHLVLHGGN